jgi:hypothetical protein
MNRTRVRSAPALLGLAAATLVSAFPLHAQGATTAVSGEVRVRTEAARPSVADEWDSFTLMRTRIGLRATLNPTVGAFVQLQDSRVFGQTVTTMSPAVNTLDLHQGYLDLNTAVGGTPLALRAGRQEIVIGNERLVGSVGWHNVGRSFDAARVTVGGGETPWSGGAFLATVHEGNATYGHLNEVGLDRDHWFTGAFAGRGPLELHALYDRNAHERIYSRINRATLGGRLQAPAGERMFGSLEGAWQTGTQEASTGGSVTAQEIRAYFAGARAGVRPDIAVLPSIGLGLDYLSGSSTATGPEYRAFNTLYATNHRYYGYMDLFLNPAARTRDRGLVDAMANVRVGLGRAGELEVDLHRFALASTADLDDGLLGWELDLTYPFRIADAGRFMVGFSAFRGGPAAPLTGLGADGRVSHWGFLQAAVPF